MEGKEVRFGIVNSALFATVTTDASCGAVNSMHDSYTPLGGLVPMFNIMTGEVIFGGVGAGLYGILLYCILAVFIAGLMVGRTPEYLGKKIEQKDIKMAMLAVIATAFSILFLIPLLAAAGSLVAKKKIPSTAGTFPTHGPLFVGLLVGTVLIVGALTFFPALSLGPIVEHFLMHGGKLFSTIFTPHLFWS